MNTQELVARIGKENAMAVVDWLELTIREFQADRPGDQTTAEYLENLTDYLRLHAASDFVETHQGSPSTASPSATQSPLQNTDMMDL